MSVSKTRYPFSLWYLGKYSEVIFLTQNTESSVFQEKETESSFTSTIGTIPMLVAVNIGIRVYQ